LKLLNLCSFKTGGGILDNIWRCYTGRTSMPGELRKPGGANTGLRKEMRRQGEEVATRYLCDKGYRILARNYYTRFGELDIVCEKDGTIVFVEVRSRRGVAFGTPEESITPAKMAKIRKTAMSYLAECAGRRYKGIRFDVITIRQQSGKTEVNHLQGAF